MIFGDDVFAVGPKSNLESKDGAPLRAILLQFFKFIKIIF